SCRNAADQQLWYIYADKDATVTGTVDGSSINLQLQQGWNQAIQSGSSSYVSGEADASYKWVIGGVGL
ncbi:MAG: hypothetical protein LBP69_10540, partial [Treponema sp.]|nr:hypothetical protein [Treponema sp.]